MWGKECPPSTCEGFLGGKANVGLFALWSLPNYGDRKPFFGRVPSCIAGDLAHDGTGEEKSDSLKIYGRAKGRLQGKDWKRRRISGKRSREKNRVSGRAVQMARAEKSAEELRRGLFPNKMEAHTRKSPRPHGFSY